MDSETQAPPIFADLALSQRLERTEGRSCAEFAESRAKRFPQSGAKWIEVAGAFVVFDGVDSPVTQTFGLGLFQKPTRSDMEAIEAFFGQHAAPVFHEVSPLADPATVELLNVRGYQPFEFTSVMYRPISPDIDLTEARNERIRVRQVQAEEAELWARTGAEGWSEIHEVSAQALELMRIGAQRPGAVALLAELDGRAIAAGGLHVCDGVALLAGASTIPSARRQGAQLALLEGRLRCAAEAGCDIAMMGAQPGSASQRNAERHGFRIAYTRIKWRLPQRTA